MNTYFVYYFDCLIYETKDLFDLQCFLSRNEYEVYTYYQADRNSFNVEVY